MYRRGDVGQTARALRLLDALRGYKQGRTLEDLAAKLGVSERTIRRDLQELADADVRVELSRVDGRAAARLVEASYSGVPVTRRERYTLLAARRVFDVLRGTSFHEDATSVLAKFEQSMNTSERKEHDTLGQHFAYVPDGGTKAYEGKEDLIDALQTGILSRKIVRFSYKDSRGRARGGDLAPFVILLYRQGLYVVGAQVGEGYASSALGDWRRGLGVFAVERFVEAEHIRNRNFEIPADFKIDDVLHGAFGVHVGDPGNVRRVVVEFSAEKADLVAVSAVTGTRLILDRPGSLGDDRFDRKSEGPSHHLGPSVVDPEPGFRRVRSSHGPGLPPNFWRSQPEPWSRFDS